MIEVVKVNGRTHIDVIPSARILKERDKYIRPSANLTRAEAAEAIQVTLGLTYFVAGQAAELLRWRGALYVPAVLLVGAGVFMLVFLRETPTIDNSSASDAAEQAATSARCPVLRL